MGYELKQVPLDFDAPINTIWHGYLSVRPSGVDVCPVCEGKGISQLADLLYSQLTSMEMDTTQAWTILKEGMKRSKWLCPNCRDGIGLVGDEVAIAQYLDEKGTDPPIGEAYQLWEDYSEGSPVTPVFANIDFLFDWIQSNGIESMVEWANLFLLK